MIPFGLLLGRVLRYPLNVYGTLLVQAILGRAPAWALAVEHFLISWGMAIPLVALLPRLRRGRPILVGALYGASLWVAVNSLFLPAVFGRQTPWQLGSSAIWPSLTVHVVYGAVVALVAPPLLGRRPDPFMQSSA